MKARPLAGIVRGGARSSYKIRNLKVINISFSHDLCMKAHFFMSQTIEKVNKQHQRINRMVESVANYIHTNMP